MTDPVILLLEAPSPLHGGCEAILRSAGYPVARVATIDAARGHLLSDLPAALILDLHLTDESGLDLLGEVLALRPGLPVIALTDEGGCDAAIRAMRAGAFDVLARPLAEKQLCGIVANALARNVGNGMDGVHRPAGTSGGIIGDSAAMRLVHSHIQSVARSMAPVFITGESGTGKDLCAQAVHGQSDRASGPFVTLNCGAIPTDRHESEIFGRQRGSFVRPSADRECAAATADGGTLFLDDICELDPGLQPSLLEFLETRTIHPLGQAGACKVDVRIICATSRDPIQAIRDGRLREDLFYRLNVLPVHMPPLRDRGDDMIAIAEDGLRRFAQEEGRGFTSFSDEVKQILRAGHWAGNVRQLLNAIRHMVVLNDGEQIVAEMLPDGLRNSFSQPQEQAPRRAPAMTDGGAGDSGEAQPTDLGECFCALMDRPLAEIERLIIEYAIDHQGGSVPRAAKALRVAPSTLYRKIEAWRRD